MPPATKEAIDGSGTGINGAVIGAFGVNLLLKSFQKSAMRFVWSMLHSLQIYRYLAMLNINLPGNLIQFVSYFDLATGKVGGGSSLPNMFVLVPFDISTGEDRLRDKFREIGGI